MFNKITLIFKISLFFFNDKHKLDGCIVWNATIQYSATKRF